MSSRNSAQAQSHPLPGSTWSGFLDRRNKHPISWTISKTFPYILFIAPLGYLLWRIPPELPPCLKLWCDTMQLCLPSVPKAKLCCTAPMTKLSPPCRWLNATSATSFFPNCPCQLLKRYLDPVFMSKTFHQCQRLTAWIPAGSCCPDCTKLVLKLPAPLMQFRGAILWMRIKLLI